MKARIMIVDDEVHLLDVCAEILEDLDADVEREASAIRALQRLREESFDLLITDLKMPEMSGIDLLHAVRKEIPDIGVIIMTAYPTVETAVQALRQGANDYVIKPFQADALLHTVERALREKKLQRENALLSRQVERPYRDKVILGDSSAVKEMLRVLDRIAPMPTDVLLLGESGTGKELAARRLHAGSGRKNRFVPLDCGAIPENLLENELFGHEKGAYTDAKGSSEGLLEFADGGTLFMDEVCEMPLSLQAKLLRTLQERQFRRVGGQKQISFDVRILAATNRDIEEEVRAGRFRLDLYYRINAVQIALPPLRERTGDITLLAQDFMSRHARELERPVSRISKGALEALERYRWPGNVRELENALKRAVALCEGPELGIGDLPAAILAKQDAPEPAKGLPGVGSNVLEETEKKYFKELLGRHPGKVREAAAEARIPLSTFYRLLKKHSLH